MKAVFAERLNSSIGKGLWFRKLYVFFIRENRLYNFVGGRAEKYRREIGVAVNTCKTNTYDENASRELGIALQEVAFYQPKGYGLGSKK